MWKKGLRRRGTRLFLSQPFVKGRGRFPQPYARFLFSTFSPREFHRFRVEGQRRAFTLATMALMVSLKAGSVCICFWTFFKE